VQRAVDLGRLLGGAEARRLHPLDQLDHLADTLKGWGIRMAFGTGDSDLIAELTGRRRAAFPTPPGHARPPPTCFNCLALLADVQVATSEIPPAWRAAVENARQYT
jgi:hypothetical protein